MNEDVGTEQTARQVFVSLLTTEGEPSASTSASGASQAFTSRVLGKRITLANLDRERPTPKDGSVAQRQVRRRNTRLWKRSDKQHTTAGQQADTAQHAAPRAKEQPAPPSKPLSRRQRKVRGLEEVDEDVSYDMLQPVHALWLAYVHRLLGLVNADGSPSYETMIRHVAQGTDSASRPTIAASSQMALQSAIVKADFVGAQIRVIRAKNPSLVGIEGLVVKESEGTFVIAQKPLPWRALHKRNKCEQVKTVPKANAVFSVQVRLPTLAKTDAVSSAHPEALEFPLYGNQLCNSLPTRATKKFKARRTIDLD